MGKTVGGSIEQRRRLLYHRMNKMKNIVLLSLIFAGIASELAFASTGAMVNEIKPCPDEFPVEAIKLSPLPEGWVGIPPSKLLLTSADVILGPPNELGMQIGKRSKTRNGYRVVFDHLYTTSAAPVEKWLACRYGSDLGMAERLPDKTDSCIVTYTRDGYNGHAIQVACHTKP
jgi:hypothetical protein